MSENEIQETAEEKAIETKTEATEEVKSETPAADASAEATTVDAKTTETASETTEAVEAKAEETEVAAEPEVPAEPEEISYHAVEKEGVITAIWEMQGPKHVRTISARSGEGEKILSLFTSEVHETDSPSMASAAAPEATA